MKFLSTFLLIAYLLSCSFALKAGSQELSQNTLQDKKGMKTEYFKADECFYIKSVANNKYITSKSGSPTILLKDKPLPGAVACIKKLRNKRENSLVFKNLHGVNVFDLRGGMKGNQVELIVYGFNGGENQIWVIFSKILNGKKAYCFKTAKHSKYLTLSGSKIIQSGFTGKDNQFFRFEKA